MKGNGKVDKLVTINSVGEGESELPDDVKVLRLFMICMGSYEAGLRELGLTSTPGLMSLIGDHFQKFDKSVNDKVGRPSGVVFDTPEEKEVYRKANRRYKKNARARVRKEHPNAKPGEAVRTTAGGVPVTAAGNPTCKSQHEQKEARQWVRSFLANPENRVAETARVNLWKFVNFFVNYRHEGLVTIAKEAGFNKSTLDYYRGGRGNPKSANERRLRAWLEDQCAQYRSVQNDRLAESESSQTESVQ